MAASELPSLAGRVCLVTGASRGIGKGIALMLGKAGATVYITGRTLESSKGKVGSLRDVATEVENQGGICIPVKCDHGNDDEVKSVFDRIKAEQNGRLDVLVNNAFNGVQVLLGESPARALLYTILAGRASGSARRVSENIHAGFGNAVDDDIFSSGIIICDNTSQSIMDNTGKSFYEQPLSVWDDMNNVGLRSNYVAAYYAAQLMVPNKQGLIVNISSAVGLAYAYNVSMGVGKAANDRMMADIAVELKKSDIAAISLWPGVVQTEILTSALQELERPQAEELAKILEHSEDPTYTGKAIAWMAADPYIMKKSGSVQVVAEVAREYGFTDVGGNQPLSFRQLKSMVRRSYPGKEWLVPEFLYMPCWLIGATMHKFKPSI